MKNKNKIILGGLIVLVLLSLSFSFKRLVLDKNYFVYMHAPCIDGYECFVYEDTETEEITDPYVKVYRKAFNVQHCLDSKECDPFVCLEDEKDCLMITCSEDKLEEGETCVTSDKI